MTLSLLDIMRTSAVIPVIAIDDPDHAVPLAKALVAGGIRVLEVTLRTQHGLGAIYITDGTMASGNPYLHLPSYWQAEVLAAAVPEPESLVLMMAGLGLLAALRRHRTG